MEHIYFLLVVPALFFAIAVYRRPFFGVLVTMAVTPLEIFVKLPYGLSMGRMVALLAFLGWLHQLRRQGGIFRRMKTLRTAKLVMPFVAVCFLGVTFSTDSEAVSFFRAITVGLQVLLSLLFEDMVNTQKRIHLLLVVVAISSTLYAIPAVTSYHGVNVINPDIVDVVQEKGEFRYAGIAMNANGLALSANMGLFILFILIAESRSIMKSVLFSCFAVTSIIGLVLSASRTHFVGLFAFLIAIILLSLLYPAGGLGGPLKVVAGMILFGAALATVYHGAPEPMQRRLIVVGDNVDFRTERRTSFAKDQMRDAIDMLTIKPLFGVGLGNFPKYAKRTPSYLGAHDTISSVLGETGALGALAFCAIVLIGSEWLRAGLAISRKTANREMYYTCLGLLASMIAMLVSGLGGYVMYFNRLLWMTIGISAVVKGWTSEQKRSMAGKEINPSGKSQAFKQQKHGIMRRELIR